MTRAVAAALLVGAAAWCAAGCCCRSGAEPVAVPESGLLTSDPSVPPEVVESWGMQRSFFIENGFEILEWEDATALLRRRSYTGGKQYHTGWLTIYTDDGRRFVTAQPGIDAFYRFMQSEGLPTTGFGTE